MTSSKPEVTATLTRSVAHLARLELSDQEVDTFTAQLKTILGYVEQLQKVDVQGVQPMTHPLEATTGLSTPMREDIVKPSPRDAQGEPKVLESAPETVENGYKVPPII